MMGVPIAQKLPGNLSIWQKTALWQAPLMAILSLEIGLFMWLLWGAAWGASAVRRWWWQLPILALLIGVISQLVPLRSADFFILILVILLPFAWRLDEKEAVSPAGLCPTIFLAGSVFIYQSQFIVLLGVVAWLLAFLLWFTTALTGFRLSSIAVRWVPILAGSVGVAAMIVTIFTLIPRLTTGFIPSFATASQQIGLTDALSPGGMSDLLASQDVAFRAIPASSFASKPRYWRVFVLAQQTGNQWQRVRDRRLMNDFVVADDAATARFQILTDTHDLSYVPIPGWPASSARATISGYGYNRYGEALLSQGQDSRQIFVHAITAPSHRYNYPGAIKLSDANPKLQEYGQKMRARYPEDKAFIAALMREFGSDFTYDTTISLPETNALDSFFFDAKMGFCSYFATSLATLLRAGGLQAHVVTGYLGGTWNSFGNYWLVKQSDAHAWVEVRKDDGSWQRLDPTLETSQSLTNQGSGFATSGADTLTVPVLRSSPKQGLWYQFEQAVALADSLNLRVTLAIMNYGDDDLTSGDDRQAQDNFALLLAGVGLAVTIIFVIFGIVRLSSRAEMVRPLAERRLEKLISYHTSPRLAGESLPSHVEKIRKVDEGAYQMAQALASSIYEMRFAKQLKDRQVKDRQVSDRGQLLSKSYPDTLKQISQSLKQAKRTR